MRLLGFMGLASLISIGCSGGATAGNAPADMADNGPAPDLAPTGPTSLPPRDPTDHPPLPQLQDFGGGTIANIELWTVVWPGDEALGARVEQFHRWMVTSDYWTGSLAEYGVGAGKSNGLVVLPTQPPTTIDDNAFTTLIAHMIQQGQIPTPNKNTVIMFIVPEKTQSTLGGSKGCQSYGGYHSETYDKGDYVYSVNLQCPGFSSGSPFDSLTDVLSHEAAEAASDPRPQSRPGWLNTQIPDGSEIGDLCVGLDYTVTAEGQDTQGNPGSTSYVVTRLYSQKRAAAGVADPCVPAPTHPYFNVGVAPADWQVTVGTSTAAIEPYAFGDVGLIKWAFEGNPGPGITVTPQSGSAHAGDTIPISVTVTSKASGGTYPVMVYTQSAKGGTNQWFSSITVQ
jgi:hypothetical protein